MNEPLTPEQARAQAIADLMAMPGPKPLKPIPPEELAWALADLPPEEERLRALEELMKTGGEPIELVLEELDRMVEDTQ
jgi:hypothetical protein